MNRHLLSSHSLQNKSAVGVATNEKGTRLVVP